ncbi:hypothetical protein ACETRX_05000 [Labrys portucalensis]|uniref:Uncharacterized protein n=1 Tax=Labrys neptuniae TaxID=376174 RepID=A0ABV6Z9W6_9HYPH
MSKLKQFVLHVVLFGLAYCVARAVIDWHRFVSSPTDMLFGSLITGLVAGITLAILTSLPNGGRYKK